MRFACSAGREEQEHPPLLEASPATPLPLPQVALGASSIGTAAAAAAMEFAELIKTSKVDGVLLSGPGLRPVKGTLCITSHHLLLSSLPGGGGAQSQMELWLLIRNVDAVEKR